MLPFKKMFETVYANWNNNCYHSTDIGAEYGDVRPLDEARMRTLTINGVQLLDRIDPNHAFVTELGSVGCITWPQREHIINMLQPRDRNDKLLEFLTRRSVADFQKFINVLSKEQAHLVSFLLTDEGETYFASVHNTNTLLIAGRYNNRPICFIKSCYTYKSFVILNQNFH